MLDVIPYLRTNSTVLFVMQDFLAQSLVHGTINYKVLTSMAYMVLLHLQLDLHVLFLTRYSPNSHSFVSLGLVQAMLCELLVHSYYRTLHFHLTFDNVCTLFIVTI
jgi:hypothetical protein